MSLNKVILNGNLTRDVEVRYAASGTAIGNSGIAMNRKYKDASGQLVEEVTFVDLTFFGRTAEIANQYCRKGSNIIVEGRLKLEQWTAQDGSKRSKHVVVVESMTMVGSKQDSQSQTQPTQATAPAQPAPQQPAPAQAAPVQQPTQAQSAQPQAQPTQPVPEISINEDEIPF